MTRLKRVVEGVQLPMLLCAAASLHACATPSAPVPRSAAQGSQDRCEALGRTALAHAPVDRLVVSAARWVPAGTPVSVRGRTADDLPAHCLVEGYFGQRPGLVGGPYRIGFRMRMPEKWNGRFLFQGGGGSNGVVGDATGPNGAGNPSALSRGYAVVAQDSGHDNDRNNVPALGGELVFGHDPQARADYGHASLKPVNDLAHHILRRFYGRDSDRNFFWGCSKGGQEGMAFAQRYPDAFDGIVAMSPGMSLPRAALAQAWDTQTFAKLFAGRGEKPTPGGFASLFTPAQFATVRKAVLAACDGLDGSNDQVIGAVGQCTTARVEPELRRRQCPSAAASGADGRSACLEPAQIDALIRSLGGPRNSRGEQLYSQFTWDSGIGAPGWLAWKLGAPGMPSRNLMLGGGSLAVEFITPPSDLPNNPSTLLAWLLTFDFDTDAPRIYAVEPPFKTSAWQDIGMRSTDLSAFRAHGGKLIVPHGVSDPVFSVMDTIDWWKAVNERAGGSAADFVRVFPVPGMNHCAGGPATDRFDSLSALEDWVIRHKPPAEIPATAGQETPWPGRSMPLCPYPEIATAGSGGAYSCRMPSAGHTPG